ncbi:MAG: lipopolysaccharide transport periplasmic protein LptA [Pseudomonadota bacterium]
MEMISGLFRSIVSLFVWFIVGIAPLHAQQSGFADSLAGFSSGSDAPIAIEADALEIQDNQQRAVFTGNVFVEQGEVTLRTRQLTVYYNGSAQDGTGGQSIERLEADGRVVVTSGDQQATGDRGVFESTKDLITLEGNVVLSQGTNVLRGKTLVVDLAAGTSRVISDSGGSGRVQGLFQPGTTRE